MFNMDSVYNEINDNLNKDEKTIKEYAGKEPTIFDDQNEVSDCECEPTEISERYLLEFSFGKNGWGLTDEITKIGERIEELAVNNYVYLADAKIDTLDDVYSLTIELHERE